MGEHQKIVKYLVSFNRLSIQTPYNDAALRSMFYKGLPSRIKDELAKSPKIMGLTSLKVKAQEVDFRYWERKEETR